MTDQELQQLRTISNVELHQATENLVRQERKIRVMIVHHLREIEADVIELESVSSSLMLSKMEMIR